MRSNQSTNKTLANHGQIKITIHDLSMTFQCEYWKHNKIFAAGVEGDADIA